MEVRPDTLEAFHFAAPVDVAAFQAEFDELHQALSQAGVEVILLTDVLADDPEALAYIARRPNVTYTRDLAVVTDGGAVLMRMALKGRQGDQWVIERALQRLGVPILGRIEPPGLIEGGGIQFLDGRTAIVSLCDRANEVAVRQLAELLLGQVLDEIIMVPLPEGEIHIDGLLMLIDRDLALAYLPSLDLYPSVIFRHGQSPQYVWLPEELSRRGVEFIEVTQEEAKRAEVNFIAVGPRRVVGYEWARRVAGEIERRGGQAWGIPGVELIKGNAGPHCMTCPILRE
jgi:N-dimethylarginine dimethylaminohydrolase